MQEVSRDFDNILFKIRYIIQTSCKDVILKSHWNITLSWFEQYDRDRIVKYWNLAPEVIENNKWEKLYQIITYNIPERNYITDWERHIVDLFTAKSNGNDLPNLWDSPTRIPDRSLPSPT